MTAFGFRVLKRPFPRWAGPYSPARGSRTGFRVRDGSLGVWCDVEDGQQFWTVQDSEGTRLLVDVITQHWGGGRVLLLPNGLVIKPLQSDSDSGLRVAVGQFSGAVVLMRPKASAFDMSNLGRLAPGDPWPGPRSIGLECVIQPDGALRGEWSHPTDFGAESVSEILVKPDAALAAGFCRARPGTATGRVRLSANGVVITNRENGDGSWSTFFVGRIAPGTFLHRHAWIVKEPT